ncbi:hypothetical protein Slala05_14710 [Streptomyces lavendulae subsp. lavendulae]|nr:hypothetical protein Slala05_14710 [Streptomyces lavendulae subsp. lavendulae]
MLGSHRAGAGLPPVNDFLDYVCTARPWRAADRARGRRGVLAPGRPACPPIDDADAGRAEVEVMQRVRPPGRW